jgi:magnesium transporter
MQQKRSKVVRIKRRQSPGAAPGQVKPHEHAGKPIINVAAYGVAQFEEQWDVNLDVIRDLRGNHGMIWIDVSEFGDRDLIIDLGETFGLHKLALEDVVNTHQRPKVEEYDDHLFIVARMLRQEGLIETEQVSFVMGEGYVISFQETPGDCFEPVRNRLRQAKGRIRNNGADYLCYSLIDSIVDEYFPALERYGEILEDLEDAVVRDPNPSHIGELHDLKRDLLMLRRAIWPHREMINNLMRDEHQLIKAETRLYLRDCYDHTIQLMDIVETYREIASGLIDVHISSVSVKLNEVMKVLTIVATVFMPLSFIASLYGMNFDRQASPFNMPELGWYFGYPFALLLMLFSACALIWYSWRKGWLFDKNLNK